MAGTIEVYRESGRGLLHLIGANPGTPYTACGVDADAMERQVRPINDAGVWCRSCMVAVGWAKQPKGKNSIMGGSK